MVDKSCPAQMPKRYHPDANFVKDDDLIYLLQENDFYKGQKRLCNDITIKIDQYKYGKNPMPEEDFERFKQFMFYSANEFMKSYTKKITVR